MKTAVIHSGLLSEKHYILYRRITYVILCCHVLLALTTFRFDQFYLWPILLFHVLQIKLIIPDIKYRRKMAMQPFFLGLSFGLQFFALSISCVWTLLLLFYGEQEDATDMVLYWIVISHILSLSSAFCAQNWYHDNGPTLSNLRKSPTILPMVFLMIALLWLLVSFMILSSVYYEVDRTVYKIERSALYESELNRLINIDSLDEADLTFSATPSTLMFEEFFKYKGLDENFFSAVKSDSYRENIVDVMQDLTALSRISQTAEPSSNRHAIRIQNENFVLHVQSHQYYYEWTYGPFRGLPRPPMFSERDFDHNSYRWRAYNKWIEDKTLSGCKLVIPIVVFNHKNNRVDHKKIENLSPTFVNIDTFNSYKMIFKNGQLVISNFLTHEAKTQSRRHALSAARQCKNLAKEFDTPGVNRDLVAGFIKEFPPHITRHLLYPGIVEAIKEVNQTPKGRWVTSLHEYMLILNMRSPDVPIFEMVIVLLTEDM